MIIFETWEGTLIFILCVLIGILISVLFSFFLVGYILFSIHLKRTSKNKWTRDCSDPDPEQVAMYEEGLEWCREHADAKRELHLVNEGLNLYAEYFDFGFDQTVIVVPGRTEGLRYAYYFGKPYGESGYNVLAIDQRAHGESDGQYNTLGFEEHKDVLAWAKLLHEDYGVKSIVLHGVCIGASCSMFALTSEACPDYLRGMVAEGMYPTFFESFKNHMIELKKPVNPCIYFVDLWMKMCTGHSMRFGPIHVIEKMNKPLLMLHGTADYYSLPARAWDLYRACPAEKKKLVWFEKGRHSRLRLQHKEQYDSTIADFLKNNLSCETEKTEA